MYDRRTVLEDKVTDFEKIVQVRIAINNPNVIAILSVADFSSLPASPAPQTAYYTEDKGYYYITDEESPESSDWEIAELYISDATILTIINNIGIDKAPCRIFSLLARKLGNESRLIRTTSGSESAEYNRILDIYNYYKGLSDDCTAQYNADNDNNSGRIGQMTQPTIAGGNL